MGNHVQPILLLILDGWGYSEKKEYNAIHSAKTPNWDRMWRNETHTLLSCSGGDVGLPDRQMGNSEVGHMHMGAGRLIDQDLSKINKQIKNGDFYENTALKKAACIAAETKQNLHIIGMLSPGGVHSHEDHIVALVDLCSQNKVESVLLHLILDGRDTPPKSALHSIQKLSHFLSLHPNVKISSVSGRYFSMDRNNNWDRSKLAFDLITRGVGKFTARTADEAILSAYDRNETDEFVSPTAIVSGTKIDQVDPNDVVVFANFRSDRARQLTEPMSQEKFEKFPRPTGFPLKNVFTMTQYKKDFQVTVAYPPTEIKNSFGEVISNIGLKQLRIAETEKYAHVTFFFNGGKEEPLEGEERKLIPSPNVTTYDLKPEMSALEVTTTLEAAVVSKKYDVVICNLANADMVGHTGDFDATVKAIETLDSCLAKISLVCKTHGMEILITADHGNAEQMSDQKEGAGSQPHTAHTNNPVPLVYIGRKAGAIDGASLVDIAPTLLSLIGLAAPEEMQGKPFIRLSDDQ
jgi:2,3-bisphosphoglycerate-independent phosphoglycerate mutase